MQEHSSLLIYFPNIHSSYGYAGSKAGSKECNSDICCGCEELLCWSHNCWGPCSRCGGHEGEKSVPLQAGPQGISHCSAGPAQRMSLQPPECSSTFFCMDTGPPCGRILIHPGICYCEVNLLLSLSLEVNVLHMGPFIIPIVLAVPFEPLLIKGPVFRLSFFP